MSLEQTVENWRLEWLQEGLEEGLQKGRQEAVQTALQIKFGSLGVAFWQEHFINYPDAPWAAILEELKQPSSTLDVLYRFRKTK